MSMHFRPKIQNGPVAKRTRFDYVAQPAPRSTKAASFAPLATVTPIWTGVSVGELAQGGLAALGLDEPLQSTAAVTKEKVSSPSRVLLCLIGCGVLLAGGFMFSLRDHFTAHAFGREEVKLKSQLDQAEVEQQSLDVKLKRVSSPQALEQAAREAGLSSLEMERKRVVVTTKKITAAEKAKLSQKKDIVSTNKAAEH